MNQASTIAPAQGAPADRGDRGSGVEIQIEVNRRHVVFREREATGAEIKATAITQGVAIQQNFALFEVRGASSQLAPVRDDETVKLHKGQRFRAVAPDDNS